MVLRADAAGADVPARALMSEINVTPLVDVMLVLLIIFMVAAPMMTVGVPIDLPETPAQALNRSQPDYISINQQGQSIEETEIPVEEVVPKLQAIAKTGYNERIFVMATKPRLRHVMKVMARFPASRLQEYRSRQPSGG